MALDLTSQGLAQDIKKARDFRDKYLGDPYSESLRRFTGPGYKRSFQANTDFNNHAYRWISIFLPLLASGNPRIRTKTPRQGSAASIAKAIEFAGNRNFELTNIKKTIEQLATDWAFKYAVAITSPRPVTGMVEREDPPYRPTTTRLSLLDYVWDPVAIQHAEARWQAHRIIRDKDSLLREAKQYPQRRWDKELIESLSMKPDRDGRGEQLDDSWERDEVEFWEIWVPEAILDKSYGDKGKPFKPTTKEGFNGTVYTVCAGMDDFIREPRAFFGPRDGPYTVSSYLYVPDRSVGLSPLAATQAQAELHNSVWAAAIEGIKRYKKGFAVSANASADLAEKVKGFEDLDVFEVEGLHEDIDKAIQELEKGGLTQQHLTMLQVLSLNLEQESGLTEAAQGQASGDGTATEAAIALQASGKRMGYMAEKFTTSMVNPIAKKEAFYLTMDPRSRTSLGPEAEGVFVDPETGEPIESPVLKGGSMNADLMEDMDIEIESVSMRFTSELLEAETSQQQDGWIATIAPLIPQMPWVEWQTVLEKKAAQWRDPSWAKIINLNKASMVGEMQLQMQLAGIPPQTPTPQPRLGTDIGGRKSSESPAGFSRNARGQQNKGPRTAGASSETHSMPSGNKK